MKIIFDLGDRKIHWVLKDYIGSLLLQEMVQAFGPAKEGE